MRLNSKNRKPRSRKAFACLCLAGGLAFLGMVFGLSRYSDMQSCEDRMNELIADDMPVRYEVVDRDNLPPGVSADRLPEDASNKVRLVCIGDYDVCPCIGKHVRSTSQIGKFVMLGTNWDEMKRSFRVRYKIV